MRTQFTLPQGQQTLHVGVSPCSWMYPNYGMQLRISLKASACNAESVFLNWKTKHEESSDVDVMTHVDEFVRDGGIARIQAAEVAWAEAQAKFARGDEKALKAERKRITARKAQGHTHRILAWVHPRAGSDFQIEAYFRVEPTKADAVALLKRQGSTVLNDFRVEAL